MTGKERIDRLLVLQGLFASREQAQRAVMAGEIFAGDQRIDKPGSKIDAATQLVFKGKQMPYVGRGGFKLEKALQCFPVTVKGRLMLDIGASTGGFTDCALQNGAREVYALDVGYNQLAWKLRSDPRVIVMERFNFRYAKEEDFTSGRPDLATIDVSFISLTKILPPLMAILQSSGDVLVLIKPQFEAGKDEVGKKGIVRESSVHAAVLIKTLRFAEEQGFAVCGLNYSPITGGDGNIEFLAWLKSGNKNGSVFDWAQAVPDVVASAHQSLANN
ncbi:MAG: TlyA family RNA methyltransferase [Sporolactobacillus sp.]